MKKALITLVVIVVAVGAVYFFAFKKQDDHHEKEQPVSVNSSDTLTGSAGLALQAYFNVKDAFTKSDTVLVNRNAAEFVTRLDSMQLEKIATDSAVVEMAAQLKQNIVNESSKMVAAAGIEAKRKSFQTVSDGMFDLLRTIRYNGSTVYQQYCPMAFDNAGAAWLSNSSEIVNPYFGEKMLNCGELRDSVSIK